MTLEIIKEALKKFEELREGGASSFKGAEGKMTSGIVFRQSDFEARVRITGVYFRFKRDLDLVKLEYVALKRKLGLLTMGGEIQYLVPRKSWGEAVSTSGTRGAIVEVQRRSIVVLDPGWRGIATLVEELCREAFGASVE